MRLKDRYIHFRFRINNEFMWTKPFASLRWIWSSFIISFFYKQRPPLMYNPANKTRKDYNDV